MKHRKWIKKLQNYLNHYGTDLVSFIECSNSSLDNYVHIVRAGDNIELRVEKRTSEHVCRHFSCHQWFRSVTLTCTQRCYITSVDIFIYSLCFSKLFFISCIINKDGMENKLILSCCLIALTKNNELVKGSP